MDQGAAELAPHPSAGQGQALQVGVSLSQVVERDLRRGRPQGCQFVHPENGGRPGPVFGECPHHGHVRPQLGPVAPLQNTDARRHRDVDEQELARLEIRRGAARAVARRTERASNALWDADPRRASISRWEVMDPPPRSGPGLVWLPPARGDFGGAFGPW